MYKCRMISYMVLHTSPGVTKVLLKLKNMLFTFIPPIMEGLIDLNCHSIIGNKIIENSDQGH